MPAFDVLTVAACLRRDTGGSPTAVVACRPQFGYPRSGNGELRDADLARIPARIGTSHVAVIDTGGGAPALRFFTATGELPSCGHGTVAAIAALALTPRHPGLPLHPGFRGTMRMSGGDVYASGVVRSKPGEPTLVDAWFDQGVVTRRAARASERDAFLAALGLTPSALHGDDDLSVASPGRERVLVPVVDRAVLAGLCPDPAELAAASRRHGQLGCFVYVPPTGGEPAAARMFAPAIGVPEDVANANSTGCLAAHLLATGRGPAVAVEQGDALGRPSTVYASATRTRRGLATRVGGTARLMSTDTLSTDSPSLK